MYNEIRSELLLIRDMARSTTEKDKEFQLQWLLERFETDIKGQLEDLENKKQELENNLELVEMLKKDLLGGK